MEEDVTPTPQEVDQMVDQALATQRDERQVPLLGDVAASDHSLMSRNSALIGHNAQPLSSTTARARKVEIEHAEALAADRDPKRLSRNTLRRKLEISVSNQPCPGRHT